MRKSGMASSGLPMRARTTPSVCQASGKVGRNWIACSQAAVASAWCPMSSRASHSPWDAFQLCSVTSNDRWCRETLSRQNPACRQAIPP
jgi:hypothetical protein